MSGERYKIHEAATYLKISRWTLYKMRAAGEGPRSFRMKENGRPYYFQEDLDAFLRQRELAEKPRRVRRSG
jgi:predicted DNA-binding transcriptional regulator AlpA